MLFKYINTSIFIKVVYLNIVYYKVYKYIQRDYFSIIKFERETKKNIQKIIHTLVPAIYIMRNGNK